MNHQLQRQLHMHIGEPTYTFQSETDNDGGVIETEGSKNRRRHLEKPLTEDEQRKPKATAEQLLTDKGFASPQMKL
jgi:hypothetical protein